MPNRILRDGIIDSARVSALSDFGFRTFALLLPASDDAGRFFGDPQMVASKLFPRTGRRSSDLASALDEIHARDLLERYEYDGEPYIQLRRWHRCGRSELSKFPWKDGSYEITYTSRPTKDGVKEFVATSLPHADGVPTGCRPHADGVEAETNTYTETETGTGTLSHTPRARGKTPTLDDVLAYAANQQPPLDAAEATAFWHHFEGEGWVKSTGRSLTAGDAWKHRLQTWCHEAARKRIAGRGKSETTAEEMAARL